MLEERLKPYYDHQVYASFLVHIKEGISVLKNLTGYFNQEVRFSSVYSFILMIIDS
jgi:hypothetical protein